jgi:serine/threonine-protein kinase RsbW
MKNFEYHENLILESNHKSLDIVESLIEKIKDNYSISKDCYFNILVAITEAVNNAISHGNHFDENKHIKFEVFSNYDELEVTITDEGTGFNPDILEDCTKEENLMKDSGRGIFIIKALTKEFEINSTEKGTFYRLLFKITH